MDKNITKTDCILPAWVADYQLLCQVFDHLPLGVLVTDLNGRIIYCNEAQCRIDDLSRDEIVGHRENDIYGPYLGPGLWRTCQDSGRPLLGFVCHYRTVKGKIINGAYWVFPVFHERKVVAALCLTWPLKVRQPLLPPSFRLRDEDAGEFDAKSGNGEALQIVGVDQAFRQALSVAQTTAPSPSPVLIAGETGTGKEMFVRAIRENSGRAEGPYQAINCSAIPASLLEGILFGATRGSFTGAVDRPGLFEEADQGLIYLDEIDSMPLELQPKLLRVIQDMKVRRLGSAAEKKLDVKIVSSISTSPAEALDSGRLRPDLFYRLAVISIMVPPLRKRLGDLDELVRHFLTKYNRLLNKEVTEIDGRVLELFRSYSWPGNVRELEHVLAGALNLVAWGQVLYEHHIPEHHRLALTGQSNSRELTAAQPPPQAAFHFSTLAEREAEAIREALRTSSRHLRKAADLLGISRQLLSHKMKKYGIDRLTTD